MECGGFPPPIILPLLPVAEGILSPSPLVAEVILMPSPLVGEGLGEGNGIKHNEPESAGSCGFRFGLFAFAGISRPQQANCMDEWLRRILFDT